jgi:hypothetical protein
MIHTLILIFYGYFQALTISANLHASDFEMSIPAHGTINLLKNGVQNGISKKVTSGPQRELRVNWTLFIDISSWYLGSKAQWQASNDSYDKLRIQ